MPGTPLERAIGYEFRDPALLEEALTHSSVAGGARGGGAGPSNEALEFLGDAVLGFLIADILHRREPRGAEGRKTRARARLVSTEALAKVANAIDLGAHVRVSDAERRRGAQTIPRVLENALEALVAAVYVDGGIDAARGVVERLFGPLVDDATAQDPKDAKGALQEWLQARGRPLPVYEVEEVTGPEHSVVHAVRCVVGGEVLARGEGSSRKKAELRAAAAALRALGGG